jgi:hypothetical protein
MLPDLTVIKSNFLWVPCFKGKKEETICRVPREVLGETAPTSQRLLLIVAVNTVGAADAASNIPIHSDSVPHVEDLLSRRGNRLARGGGQLGQAPHTWHQWWAAII